MREEPVDEDIGDWAALYAIGALDPAERERWERRYATDERFRAAVDLCRPAVEALAEAASPAAPPEGLRERVLARARASGPSADASPAAPAPWKDWRPDAALGSAFVAAAQGAFEPTAHAGVRVRRLFVDAERDRVTMLIRMEAGARYPAHRHAGPEECFVLEGDLQVGEELCMRAGDYQRVGAGFVHPVQATEAGCLLLIVSSQHDELLRVG